MELKSIFGISDKREREYNKLNVYTAEDLLKLFPKTYLDMTRCTPISQAYHNDIILTLCTVLSVEVLRGRRPYVRANCVQQGAYFKVFWFNSTYAANTLTAGQYYMYGRVQIRSGFGVSMINPSFEPAEDNTRLSGIAPVYPLAGTLSQGLVRAAIRRCFGRVIINSAIPEDIIQKYDLTPLPDAYRMVHMPKSMQEIETGSERIALEEFFILLSAFKIIKGDSLEERVNSYPVTSQEVKEFTKRFEFDLTPGQKEAVNEIYKNVRSPYKMNRLIQGDVGSGKTAVALCAIFMAVKSGYQAAMLSPTEILARQTYDVMRRYFKDYNVAYLSGSLPVAEKKAIKRALALGEIDILCGTHAVIQKDVAFSRLALCVCDEQHRFGVAQRSSLSDKGMATDVLVMSATPIPRTLSLIFYGDLDITVIRDKPKERQPISTSVVPPKKYEAMLTYVADEAKKGRQSYFVCPRIEEDEEGEITSVTELCGELKSKKPGLRVALLHGKMKDAEKDAVMADFKAGKTDCLVSTTVIEVGVDVPNATIMIIYNAERFGLAQLHQLRGRVGRGSQKSYCFLLMGKDTPEGRERLNIMKNCSDGFELAESDLKMRGGGEFMGTRQSGKAMMAELRGLRYSVQSIYKAKDICDDTFAGGYDLSSLRVVAAEKYKKLEDVVLN